MWTLTFLTQVTLKNLYVTLLDLQGVDMTSSSVRTVAVFQPRMSVTATTIVEIGLTNETVVSYVLYVPAYNRQKQKL